MSMPESSFTLPPKVAKLDAVRKLTTRLTDTTGLGATAAETLAHAVVDPAAVRGALTGSLPGLSAHRESHLQVIPARVWTSWVTLPADEILRYGTRKRFPASDPSIPHTPRVEETDNGFILNWASRADRDWHLNDNKQLYDRDIYTDRLRIFPEWGGIASPLVLAPQTETFEDGSAPLHLLRITDGQRRYYEVMDLLKKYADLDQAGLDAHFGPDKITPEVFRAALDRDHAALGRLVNAVRDRCTEIGYGAERQQYIGVHYLAACLSLPAYIAIGTTDPVTSEVRPMGSDQGYPVSTVHALSLGMSRWHGGHPARLVVTGQREYHGLMLPEASVDEKLIETAARRLRVQGVPKEIITFGTDPGTARAAGLFVWWTRAIRQLGGTPATAVAAFARHTELTSGDAWPQVLSRPLLAAASHMMEEDIDVVFPSGDYRDPEARPDSLSLLTGDVQNLTPVAALSDQGKGNLLGHPRWRNAVHVALAHLALTGALPAREPLPGHVLHPRLLSLVGLAWADKRMPVLHDDEGRAVSLNEHTLGQSDPAWAKALPWSRVQYMEPPSSSLPSGATHAFKLKHGVVLTIPAEEADEEKITDDPGSLAAVVRRWLPGATDIALTDWSDKYITGIMVGSVFVRLYDRKGESEDARSRGVWYTDGNPDEAKDVVDLDDADSGAPAGELLGAGDWLRDRSLDQHLVDLGIAYEAMAQELDDLIINEVDAALEAQAAADARGANGQDRIRPRDQKIPVLRLPEIKRGRR